MKQVIVNCTKLRCVLFFGLPNILLEYPIPRNDNMHNIKLPSYTSKFKQQLLHWSYNDFIITPIQAPAYVVAYIFHVYYSYFLHCTTARHSIWKVI